MFFSLTNSSATFQTIMDVLFCKEIMQGHIIVYMDDILIITKSNNIEDHIEMVSKVLQILADNDLFLKPEKCHFHKREVEYLGIIIGNGYVMMDLIKVKGIIEWPIPQTVQELHAILRFGNYDKDFIQDYSLIAHPLHNLTRKATLWKWEEEEQTTFDELKCHFTSYPVL
jgi:hypothetical protein